MPKLLPDSTEMRGKILQLCKHKDTEVALNCLDDHHFKKEVIVDTEKVLQEVDGSVKLVAARPHTDGKVFAPGCASKPDGESREEPEEHKRIIGISMGLETCQILGQVSHS